MEESLEHIRDGRPLLETTHTPQGDGNLSMRPIMERRIRNNPHPARGRKRRVRSAAGSVRKQPTPRKGTETG